tara:strand:+ start:625 stop:804 length:180 start_codon:yes stop_codon:yes gene_type:complete
MEFDWNNHRKIPDYGKPEKLISKIPMMQRVICSEYGLWEYMIIEGKVKYVFQYWLMRES